MHKEPRECVACWLTLPTKKKFEKVKGKHSSQDFLEILLERVLHDRKLIKTIQKGLMEKGGGK